ncbi:MAG: DUF917 family protein [Candidatus Thorarchaeota archaeon]
MKLSKENALDMLIGAGILGTGGGGHPENFGKPIVEWDYARGRVYELTDPEQVRDDAFIVCGGYMGSVKAFTSVGNMLEVWESRYELLEAMRVTEKITGKKVVVLESPEAVVQAVVAYKQMIHQGPKPPQES